MGKSVEGRAVDIPPQSDPARGRVLSPRTHRQTHKPSTGPSVTFRWERCDDASHIEAVTGVTRVRRAPASEAARTGRDGPKFDV